MRIASFLSLAMAGFVAFGLAGCNPMLAPGGEATLEVGAVAPSPASSTTVVQVVATPVPDGQADLELGQTHFAAGRYGLAEMHFRKAVESPGATVEAWLGLAASYDQLRRYDLADRAYGKAEQLGGRTAAYLNNRGYSYLQRRNYKLASQNLSAGLAKDPGNPEIAANLQELDKQVRLSRPGR
jgi:Flp pilus assembly protein TadD